MSKLAHSNDATMAEIERNHARDQGDLRRCTTCSAENIIDDPDCPRGGVGCNVITIQPTTAPSEE